MDTATSAELFDQVDKLLKPYKEGFLRFPRLPEKGLEREQVLREMQKLHSIEEATWKQGYASGAVYHGDDEHINFLSKVYAINSQSNPLHPDIWPSATKFEAEIVSMTAGMLSGSPGGVCGTVSSGGTESILLAMKTYRDWAEAEKGITEPEIIAPVTAHAAFVKAS